MKQEFLELLKSINREGMENLIAFIEKTDFFDKTCIGGIVSAYEKMIKPNEEIYKLLLNRFNLKAEECLFIDDNLDNVNAAIKLEINSFQLKNMNDMSFELKNIIK